MKQRITTSELSPRIRRLRRIQVVFAVIGMAAFLLALTGGAIESSLLAWIGIFAFLLCLISILTAGALTWGAKSG